MFTGLVETVGIVRQITPEGPGVRLVVEAPLIASGISLGDSIAVSGCCMTVVEFTQETMQFEAGSETLSRTILGRLKPGDSVNLERSLKVGDRLGGHFVTGHVDTVGRLKQRIDEGNWSTLWFSLPAEFAVQLASKGSIAVDGVSLTLVDVTGDSFSVALIPHTLEVTTLGKLKVGDAVNLETDLLAKYVARQLAGLKD